MPHGYSIDLRSRALASLKTGLSRKKVAEIFNISTRTLYNWCKRFSETGDIEIKERPKVRSHRKLTPELLSRYLKAHPDAYLKEIGKAFGVSDVAVHKALQKFGMSRKKNDPLYRARREKEARVSIQNRRL